MDYKPDQNQQDQSDIELEITDIDAEEAGDRSTRPSRFEPIFTSLAHHARFLSAFAIFVGCVITAILLFPDVASLVKPIVPSPTIATPTMKPTLFVASGRDNVTLIMRVQGDAKSLPMVYTWVTAYDTQSGTLLWHTPQSQSSTITYRLAYNTIDRQGADIYALHSDGLISFLAPRTGKTLWNYKLPLARSRLFAVQDDVFLLRSDNTFYAVKDGRLLWHNAESGETLAIENGVVYTYSPIQKRYYAINEESGARLWSYTVPQSIQSSLQTFRLPIIENNIFYVQTIDNKVLAIQSQGHVLWSHTFNDAVNLKSDTHHLYVVDQVAETIEVLNLQTGNRERIDTNEIGAISIIDIQNDLLYIQTDEGVRVANANTGKIVWEKATTLRQEVGIANGILYIILYDTDSMQAINGRDGTLLWSGVIKGQVASDGRMLDALSSDNSTISVLRLSDGKTVWSKHIE